MIIVDLFVNEVWKCYMVTFGYNMIFFKQYLFLRTRTWFLENRAKNSTGHSLKTWPVNTVKHNKALCTCHTGWFTTHVLLSCELIVSQALSFLISFAGISFIFNFSIHALTLFFENKFSSAQPLTCLSFKTRPIRLKI